MEIPLQYPRELVHKYGAKAGLLMHVAKHLPNIPQAEMIVKSPNESIDDFLKRADNAKLLWPRVFRSSAVEELIGFEGDFPTEFVGDFREEHQKIVNPNYWGPYRNRDLFDKHVRAVINRIETSPERMRDEYPGLPDKICVIAVEKSPSVVTGTLIKHPNRRDPFFIMAGTYSWLDVFGNTQARKSVYFSDGRESVKRFEHFSSDGLEKDRDVNMPAVLKDLETVVSWYNPIVNLPEMDQNWGYQLEFGVDPPCLYQVRPFRPIELADFKLGTTHEDKPLVFGITPKGGLQFKVVSISGANYFEEKLNSERHPAALQTRMRDSYRSHDVHNVQANIFYESYGLLAHGDISSIRQARVSVLFPSLRADYYESGGWINIVSDGQNVDIKCIKSSQKSL